MTERLHRQSTEGDLDAVLRDLGDHLRFPPTPDLTSQVRYQLEAGAGDRTRPWILSRLRRVAVPAMIGLLMIAGTTAAVGLGLRGLAIVVVDSGPSEVDTRLDLGAPVAGLEEAEERAGFALLLPGESLGDPDEVFVASSGRVPEVSLLYGTRDQIELLITQSRETNAVAHLSKEIGPRTTVESLTVADQPALWIEGEPHVLRYRDAAGDDFVHGRLAGNVLVWQEGDLLVRIEGPESLPAALAIAETMRRR